MLSHLVPWSKGALALLLMLAHTLFWFPQLLIAALLKLAVPLRACRKACTIVLMRIAEIWISNNSAILSTLHSMEWDVRGLRDLSPDEWYLVTCNHQSWADIPIIQYALNRRIPLLKFFLKRELIWVPFLGIAWWALDFPFMQRHTKAQIAKNPSLKGKDLETTRRACEKFRYTPVTVFNFLEGTRFTPEKQQQQNSPFEHLLRPRAGGTAFVLGAMGEQLHTLLDVTIVYPDGKKGFWDLLCGEIPRIVIDIRTQEIPEAYRGCDYGEDAVFRESFQRWLGELWTAKDAKISAILGESRTGVVPETEAVDEPTSREGSDPKGQTPTGDFYK